MSKILVTGATGFIGKHLIPKLRNAGHEVFEVSSNDGDIANEITWENFPQTDMVIHLAAKSFVPASWQDPNKYINCNVLGTVAALNYCRKFNAGLIFISSYLYGNPASLPIPENAPLKDANPYALSKHLAEDVCQFYSRNFNIDITIFRPFNVYGPHQPEEFLIPSIMRQIRNKEIIKVKDFEPKRDYIYIDDIITAILAALNNHKGLHIYNLGSGISYSVKELIRIIQDVMESDLDTFSEDIRRKDEIMDTVADISLAEKELGWIPKWQLAEGLKEIKKKY